MRHARELSTTSAPAGGELRRPLARRRAARAETARGRSPRPCRRAAAGRPGRRASLPAERSEANSDDLVGRERALREQRRMTVPTAPVAPRRPADPHRELPEGLLGADRVRRRRGRRRRAARARRPARARPGSTQEMRIGEVEIISMLMPLLAEGGEDLRRDAGVGLHAGADDGDLAHRLVGRTTRCRARRRPARARRAPSCRSSRGHRERHLGARALGHRLVLDDHVDVDVGLGQRGGDAAGDAGRVRARRRASRGPRRWSG